MKKIILTSLLLFAAAISLSAQIYEDLTTDFRARVSAGINKRIVTGLHVTGDVEFRAKDMLSSVDRFAASAGLTYKVCPYFKMGLGYTFIAQPKTTDWRYRHRAYFDLMGTYKTGNWSFSLRERFQYTYRAGTMNIYQEPRNYLILKTRLKASYKCNTVPLTPYVAVHLRNPLNASIFSEDTHSFVSYGDFYLDRVRVEPGLEYRLTRCSSLNFSVLLDYCMPKSYDADKSGVLKTDTDGNYMIYYGKSFNTSLVVGYVFSF